MIAGLALALLLLGGAQAEATPDDPPVAVARTSAEALAAFDPLVGGVWRGASISDPAIIDELTFERVAGGQAIRSIHSVNGGAYTGETLIVFDPGPKLLTSFYATNGGFYTTGTAEARGPGRFVFDQVVHGLDGVEAVQATTAYENGVYSIRSRHRVRGEWVETGGFDYRRVAEAP